jgi:hypothetical protein
MSGTTYGERVMQQFVIPIRFDSFNDYTKKLKQSKPERRYFPARRYKTAVEEQIVWYIKAARIRPIKHPVFISFLWYEEKKGREKSRDKDNIAFAKKFILDRLQKRKVLPNDNDDWVRGFRDFFVYGEGQKVIVRIEGVDEAGIMDDVGEADSGSQKGGMIN